MSKKEHILNVAETLFNEFGFAAVGVDLIRDSAKVSKTSLYRYFGSKNSLIESVLMRRHQRFAGQLTSAVNAATDMNSRLDAILDWHFAWFKAINFRGCMFMHALAEFRHSDQNLSEGAVQHKLWLRTLISNCFSGTEYDIKNKTEAIMTLVEGMIIRAEFGEFADHEVLYRLSVKALAVTDFTPEKSTRVLM